MRDATGSRARLSLGITAEPTQMTTRYENGRHATTYPDMLWEPEKSFKAVADYYAADFVHDKEESHPGNTTATVTVQIAPNSKPSMPIWMGEVATVAHMLTHTGMLTTIQEQVRFARARFGHYDLSTLLPCSSAIFSRGSQPCSRFTNGSRRLPNHS
jgi:hypothetical protein